MLRLCEFSGSADQRNLNNIQKSRTEQSPAATLSVPKSANHFQAFLTLSHTKYPRKAAVNSFAGILLFNYSAAATNSIASAVVCGGRDMVIAPLV